MPLEQGFINTLKRKLDAMILITIKKRKEMKLHCPEFTIHNS